MPFGGDKKRWDCTDCQSYQLDKKIRNCGGKYPGSDWGKNGYDLEALTVYQCPKTFVSSATIQTIKFCDSVKEFGEPSVLENYCARIVQIYWFIQSERRKITKRLDQEKDTASSGTIGPLDFKKD